jgi:hypothetical protein
MRPSITFAKDPTNRCWLGIWGEKQFELHVTGDDDGPNPLLRATAWDVTDRLDEMEQAILDFAAALPPDAILRFRPREDGICLSSPGIPLSSSGISLGELDFLPVEVREIETPARASLVFSTARPDVYALYVATLDGGRPVALHADFW